MYLSANQHNSSRHGQNTALNPDPGFTTDPVNKPNGTGRPNSSWKGQGVLAYNTRQTPLLAQPSIPFSSTPCFYWFFLQGHCASIAGEQFGTRVPSVCSTARESTHRPAQRHSASLPGNSSVWHICVLCTSKALKHPIILSLTDNAGTGKLRQNTTVCSQVTSYYLN